MTVIIIVMLFYCIYSLLYCTVIIPCSKKDMANNHDTNNYTLAEYFKLNTNNY